MMGLLFDLLREVTGSAGTSVVLLSVLVAIATYPLRVWAQGVEARARSKKQEVDKHVVIDAQGLKGEEKFRVVEKIYEKYGYHPIQGVVLGVTFFVMLPFLLAALFLFADNPSIADTPYLIIPDLSQPDHLIGGVNVLPFVMSAITVIDAKFRFASDNGAFLRFCLIALILLVLVYPFPAALVLYWTMSNLISFATYILSNRFSGNQFKATS